MVKQSLYCLFSFLSTVSNKVKEKQYTSGFSFLSRVSNKVKEKLYPFSHPYFQSFVFFLLTKQSVGELYLVPCTYTSMFFVQFIAKKRKKSVIVRTQEWDTSTFWMDYRLRVGLCVLTKLIAWVFSLTQWVFLGSGFEDSLEWMELLVQIHKAFKEHYGYPLVSV